MHTLYRAQHALTSLLLFSSVLAGPRILYPVNMVGAEPDVLTDYGYEMVAITESGWRKMTTGHFASFDAILIGDSFCASEIPSFIKNTMTIWSPAVKGNVMVAGNAPSHAVREGVDEAKRFLTAAADFVTNIKGATGLLFSLSCYFKDKGEQIRDVEELSYFGSFKAYGSINDSYQGMHTEASHPTLEGISQDDLFRWGTNPDDRLSQSAYFSKYPDVGRWGFEVFAITKTDAKSPRASLFQDDVYGLPFILTRGATPRLCGDGERQWQWKEECDEGHERNGQPDSLCNKSCKCKFGTHIDWKDDDPKSGRFVVKCNVPEGWPQEHKDLEEESGDGIAEDRDFVKSISHRIAIVATVDVEKTVVGPSTDDQTSSSTTRNATLEASSMDSSGAFARVAEDPTSKTDTTFNVFTGFPFTLPVDEPFSVPLQPTTSSPRPTTEVTSAAPVESASSGSPAGGASSSVPAVDFGLSGGWAGEPASTMTTRTYTET